MGNVAVPDTVEKTVQRLSRVATQAVYWGPKQHLMNEVLTSRVSIGSSLFRTFTCKRGCRSCCQVSVTLDYNPLEPEWHRKGSHLGFESRVVHVNGKPYIIYSLVGEKFKSYDDPCPYLKIMDDGFSGCSIWPDHPLECFSNPVIHFRTFGEGEVRITKQPFSRAWRYREKMECDFTKPLDLAELDLMIRVFQRYRNWALYFNIPTILDSIIEDFVGLKTAYEKGEYHFEPKAFAYAIED